MGSTQETLEAVQKVLQPYVRPREEVAHIRRILTLHLGSGFKDGGASLTEPLSLTKSSEVPSYPQEARGTYREYLEALSANIKARREYETLLQKHSHPGSPPLETAETQPNYLLHHIASLKIQKKQEKLKVEEKNLDYLRQKPAASPDFLDHQRLFRGCRPLPNVPTEVVNSLAVEQTSENVAPSRSVQLNKDLIDSLEHRTFQTKLSLKHEESLLDKAKVPLTGMQSEDISPEAKLHALNASRTELINWIETELGKASSSGDGGIDKVEPAAGQDAIQARRERDLADRTNLLNQQLASIKGKYAKYLSERKALLELVTTQLHNTLPSASSFNFPAITTSSFPPTITAKAVSVSVSPERPSTTTTQATSETKTAVPITDHLLTPTLSHLLHLSHDHKGLLAHKAHTATLLSKQLKENTQALDHLAEESQLLPSQLRSSTILSAPPATVAAVAAAAAAVAALQEDHSDDSSTARMSDMIKPWVSAAEAAKIATFETVAQKIEEGQTALEGAVSKLAEADRLLGRKRQHQKQAAVKAGTGEDMDVGDDEGEEEDVGDESDIWLVEGQKSLLGGERRAGGTGPGTNRDEGARKGERTTTGQRAGGSKSVWDFLDVDVGLEEGC